MKRFLVTTALASLVAGSAFAADMSVKVGGDTDFEAAYVKYSETALEKNASANQKHVKFRNRAKVYVAAHGKAENGMSFGANVRVSTNIQANDAYSNGKMDKTYLWLESSAGRVEMGSNYGVTRLMRVGAESVAAATGGASDGNWVDFADLTGAGAGAGVTQLAEEAAIAIKSGDSFLNRNPNISRKISWMSPRYSGVQFGLTYAPDTGNVPALVPLASDHKNLIAAALNYSGTFNDVNVAASYGFEHAKHTNALNKNLNSHVLGLMAAKGPMSVAASYGTDGKSGELLAGIDANKHKSYYYTVGAAYEQGPMKASVTYLSSKKGEKALTKNHARMSVYSAGLDYKVASGMKAFAEFNHFNMKSSENNVDNTSNKGTVVLVGTKLSF